jgi:hypothetical protein
MKSGEAVILIQNAAFTVFLQMIIASRESNKPDWCGCAVLPLYILFKL